MFRVKICGIKDRATAEECVRAGADAIGLNFFPKSKRFVADDAARQISAAVSNDVLKVGLFVNEPADVIADKVNEIGLDVLQLHGDEEPTIVDELQSLGVDLPIIKAVRISAEQPNSSIQEIKCWSAGPTKQFVKGILLDAKVEGTYGGTGKQIDWNWLSRFEIPTSHPILLAGGLNPQNVGYAIEQVRPYGVDVAGGVENESGEKDVNQIKLFVENARKSIDRN